MFGMFSEPRIWHELLLAHTTHTHNPTIFRMVALRLDARKHFLAHGKVWALEHFKTASTNARFAQFESTEKSADALIMSSFPHSSPQALLLPYNPPIPRSRPCNIDCYIWFRRSSVCSCFIYSASTPSSDGKYQLFHPRVIYDWWKEQ